MTCLGAVEKRRWRLVPFVLVAGAAAGCLQSDEAGFRLNKQGPTFQGASAEQDQVMVDVLTAVFGTPDEPFDANQFAPFGLDMEQVRFSAGSAARNGQGDRRGLYREHCAHCHGISGDGAGPTARFLNPYPRDYRNGKFKFTSTGTRPTADDLKRTLVEGIPGTAMPSFALLPNDELDALVEYVRYLAIRGEVESFLFDLVVNQDTSEVTVDVLADEVLPTVVSNWTDPAKLKPIVPPVPTAVQADADGDGALSREEAEARLEENFAAFDANKDGALDEREQQAKDANGDGQIDDGELVASGAWPDPALLPAADADGDKRISREEGETRLAEWFAKADADEDGLVEGPERLAASVADGSVLFQKADRGKCSSCHGPTGLGDGEQVNYDFWNDQKKEMTADEIAELWTLPIQRLKTRNLRQGTYRGGRRPVDLYRRVHAGIGATPMPAQGATAENRGALSPDEIWDVVNYVRSLPYEESSQAYPHQAGVKRDIN
jgi:mono/diheme cytochrome c family protein